MRLPPKLEPLPPEGVAGPGRLGSLGAYVTAVVVTVVAILSQYFVPELVPALVPLYGSLLGGLLIVYGIPILAFAVLVGSRPLARWSANGGVAAWEGVRWYSLLLILAILITGVLAAIYNAYDPAALKLLTKPNPVLQNAAGNPYFWIAFSFVIGAVEETIFRGWIFGYWLARGTDRWEVHAVWTSAVFAGVHLYYGTTYGPAAPLIYPTLFLIGLSFAATVRASGGNLWVAALLHGAHDSAAFLSLISPTGALVAEYGIVAIGVVIAIIDVVLTPSSATPAAPAPAGFWSSGPSPPTAVLPPWAWGEAPYAPPPAPPPPPPIMPGPPPPPP